MFIELEGAETGESEDHALGGARRSGVGVGSSPRRVRTAGREERSESGLERRGDGESGLNMENASSVTPGNGFRKLCSMLFIAMDAFYNIVQLILSVRRERTNVGWLDQRPVFG